MQKRLVVIGVVVLFALAIGCSENALMQGDYHSVSVVRPDLIDEVVMQPALLGFDGVSIVDVVTAGGIKANPIMYLVDRGRLSLSTADETREDIGITTRNGELIALRTAFNVIGNFDAVTFGMKGGITASPSPAGKYHSLYFTYGDVDNDGDSELTFGQDTYFFDATGLWYADRPVRSPEVDETRISAFGTNEVSKDNEMAADGIGSYSVDDGGKIIVSASSGILEGLYDSVHKFMVIVDSSPTDGIGVQYFVQDEASETVSMLGIYNFVKMAANPTEATFIATHGQLIFDAGSVYMSDNDGIIENEDWGTWEFEEDADGVHRVSVSLPGSNNDGLIGLGTHDGEVLILQKLDEVADEASLLWAFKAP